MVEGKAGKTPLLSEDGVKMLRRESMERPRENPPGGVPIALRTVFHAVLGRGRFWQSWSKRFVMAKWIVKGHAVMGLDGVRTPFGPGEVAIYLPSNPHQFWATDEVNEIWWFTADGPMAEQLVFDLDLHAGIFSCGEPPVDLLGQMMESLRDHSIQGHRKSSLLAIRAWYQLAEAIQAPAIPSEIVRAKHIMQQEYANPDLSVEILAQKLHYHRGSLSRLFHKHTGTTIIQYLSEVRLQAVRSMLQHTDSKIVDVAKKCGFRDVTYFCSWLRKHTGSTPKNLRYKTRSAQPAD